MNAYGIRNFKNSTRAVSLLVVGTSKVNIGPFLSFYMDLACYVQIGSSHIVNHVYFM